MVGNDLSPVKRKRGKKLDIGQRLKNERLRLELSQAELAAELGTNKKSQTNYELGHNQPSASYLAAAARLGIDVAYVLTGERAPTVSTVERELLRLFRSASPDLRAAVMAGLTATAAPSTSSAPRVAIHGGEQGQVIAGDAHQERVQIRVGGAKKKRQSPGT